MLSCSNMSCPNHICLCSRLILLYPTLSYLIPSYPIMSSPHPIWLFLSFILFHTVLTCLFPIPFCPSLILSYPYLSCFYPIPPHPILNPTLAYSSLIHPILL